LKEEIIIRKIIADDDTKVATIIRRSLEDFGAVKQGTVYYDESTDHLHEVFQTKRSAYFIAVINGEVCGGAGIFPTDGLPQNTCELVKMYVSSAARGKGLGKLLLQKCMDEATKIGFKKMYIETMPELTNAIAMYKKNGFTFIPSSLGNSGHSGCDMFMIKDL
jgi:putative acetyltransferase